MKRVLCVLCAILTVFMLLPSASAAGTPTVAVSQVNAQRGDSVDVYVTLQNNPGLITMRLDVHYDASALTLTGVTDLGLLPGQTHSPDYTANPYTLYWDNGASATDYTGNGNLVKLTFAVSSTAGNGNYAVSVSYDASDYDVFNAALVPVNFTLQAGGVQVTRLRGDTNLDGERNAKDVTVLRRGLAGGYGIELDPVDNDINDINGDDIVNAKDVTLLRRYLAGGYGITLD